MNLRPQEVAAKLHCSKRKVYEIAAADPDFPPWIKLSPRVSVIRECDLEHYMERKAQAAGRASGEKRNRA